MQTIVPTLVRTVGELRQLMEDARRQEKTVGVVMTMGALHDGHLQLVRTCRQKCDLTVVTIFVNPTQFLPGEDFERYPRHLEQDLKLLTDCQAEIVFAPTVQEIYGDPAATTVVRPPDVANLWEGRCRPGHYQGVCTIVLKLLNVLSADFAFFGHKDYQQYVVIRTMAAELNVPTEIVVLPTVREPDGMAMSSRNRYLSDSQRQQAAAIFQSLTLAQSLVRHGTTKTAELTARMRQHLVNAGITKIDYVSVVDPNTMQEGQEVTGDSIACIAAHVGQTRLIDNLRLSPPANRDVAN